jgi:hypothetical protein
MTLYIAGSVFLALSIAWWFIQERAKRNKKHEEGTSDAKDAVKKHSTGGLFDAIRRRMLHR